MKRVLLLGLITVFLVSCSKDDNVATPDPQVVALKNPVNNFTWQAMNSWYNWQEQVPNLADTKDDKTSDYNTYLNTFDTPQKLFESLLYQKGTVDRFSWFIEDYVEQEKAFQGTSTSFGFRPKPLRINNTNIVLLVLHVSKDSPAAEKGLKRGDVIIGINNQVFTTSNYQTVIQDYFKDNAEFILGENDGVTQKSKVTLTKREVNDNAIHVKKVFDDVDGKKVGYLVYSGFRSSYDKDLNNAFGEFKAAGIQELILDFRYNGGGSVLSCGYLASMIHGEGTANSEVFAKTVYNKKHTGRGFTLPFLSGIYQYDAQGNYLQGQDIPLNRLTGLSKIYVITSESTASASEMIINGLRPYIDVVTVGTKSYGKNVGSITLYDAPASDFTDKSQANSTHKMAMQPITFQIFNKLDQSDYTNGFAANIEVNEFESWNNFLPFGDENEVILKTILDKIKGVSSRAYVSAKQHVDVLPLKSENKFETEMYFESEFLKNQLK
ncbi:S41 family peptidase [uncultured Tenacibaculum sp.]|uniref:S41 family peptidase n=1 Tax=uncultured Tenacibaculum sp. TaxID=174713 RepID=UPI00263021DA|nr:S41 family peptidase [uncultured Tenacibaculum sp.]